MLQPVVPIWKKAPFIRLLIPLILGIILEWYFPATGNYIYLFTGIFLLLLLLALSLRGYFFYLYKWILGVAFIVIFILLGVIITYFKNITHQQNWFGHYYNDSTLVVAVLSEPLTEKNKSYKAVAEVYALIKAGSLVQTKGKIILYFKKDSSIQATLKYGSAIVFKKQLQPIRNAGNPGAFDYHRYCLFQGITHQVYLTGEDFSVNSLQSQSAYARLLQRSRNGLLEILKKYISGRQEAGVAEALLIGYRDDLDRDLLQAYANTGVIHVIAISGMHLAMIYGLLIVLLKPLERKKNTKWIRGLAILSVIWLFTLLSGAGASILRSAVMFSFIVIGESVQKKVSVYHTLSASAFFLLCWNPFFLWDVGFQLSYAAVLSIVIFQQPLSRWIYVKQGYINQVWKLTSVTLAAQILTTPLSIFHFHQVPNLFLISNLVIVPLSGLILYGEILLCLLSWFPAVALFCGKVLTLLLQWMNTFIQFVNDLPFAVSDHIVISVFQTVLLYVFIVLLTMGLMGAKKQLLYYAIVTLQGFVLIRLVDAGYKHQQKKLVVYNIPRISAVDFISGRNCAFRGDISLLKDPYLYNFHLQPSRMLLGIHPVNDLKNLKTDDPFFYFHGRRILFLDSGIALPEASQPVDVDIIILSKNVNIQIAGLLRLFRCQQFVFDASCPIWKIQQWKNECDSLHLRRHSVQEEGAFILDL